ncbi:MAG: hypothetical protein R3315_06365 [Woeseiaceae bacterium]|nr:hypothetical protein [Woeseiaceae bacterium]
MRILMLLALVPLLAGCSSMLLGGSGTYSPPPDQCQQENGEERKRDC